jgi:hypothetical protein
MNLSIEARAPTYQVATSTANKESETENVPDLPEQLDSSMNISIEMKVPNAFPMAMLNGTINIDINDNDKDIYGLSPLKPDFLDLVSDDESEYAPSHASSVSFEGDQPPAKRRRENGPRASTPVESDDPDASFITPLGHDRSRIRQKNPSQWKDNIRKRRKNTGQSYTRRDGRKVRQLVMGAGCGVGCRQKCHDKFSNSEREGIFHEYWKMGEYERHQEYLARYVQRNPVKRRRGKNRQNSRRAMSFKFSLPCGTASVPVCKTFFLSTLGVSEKTVYGAMERVTAEGITPSDGRGKHGQQRKVSNDAVSDVMAHIASFKAIPSHYCRQNSQRVYLTK